ncbi:MAG: sigma-70 family RNA polymerase sigma factor [Planctomycetota bacterium]|nr:sigma-70 family RNA polymerase sigma factor [Planctomycetota bacterium]
MAAIRAVTPNADHQGLDVEPGFREQLGHARSELTAYARRLLGGGSRAGLEPEDLVQETLARALRFEDRYDPARPLVPWLRQVLLRRFLDELRRRRAAPVEAPVGFGMRPGVGGNTDQGAGRHRSALEPICTEPQPAEQLARREEAELLLANLDEPERSILDGFHRRGRSIAELAAELAMPSGTIKSHLHRARQRLATLFRSGEDH